jgi:hypothetical protein
MNKIPFLYQYKTKTLCQTADSEQHYDKEIQMNIFENGSLSWSASRATSTHTASSTTKTKKTSPGGGWTETIRYKPPKADRRVGS